jgi:drug/metabolite transporter (DMT)-like permease
MERANNHSMSGAEWALLVALSVLWGGSFFFIEVAVNELPPLTIVTARLAIAAATLLAIMAFRGHKLPLQREVWLAFLAMGLLNNVVPFSLIVWGQTHIASGVASILNATTPLFTVVLAHFLTADERLTRARFIGVSVGFCGVAIMIGVTVFRSIQMDALAQLAVLAAALSYALAGIFGRRFKEMGVQPMATATGQVMMSTIILMPVAMMVDRPWTLAVPSPSTIASLLGLAILSTAIAYILYFRILSTAGATNLLLVTFLIPISAIILGVVVLGETLAAKHVAGMLLVGLGLAAIDGRPIAAIRRRFTRRRYSDGSLHGDGG